MSSITLPTRGLVGLLEDLSLTAADPKMELPHLTAVLLHTAKGDFEVPQGKSDDGEPLFETVPSDLLVATSTCLSMIGQGHTACTGRLHKPALIDLLDIESVIKVFKPLITKRLPKGVIHQSVVTLSTSNLIVSEDPDLVPGGKSVSMTVLDSDPFPRNTADLLEVDPERPVVVDGRSVPVEYGTGLGTDFFTIVGKIAARRDMTPAVYRHHQQARIVVEVGGAYRAVVMPVPLQEDRWDGPVVEVFSPPLPPRPVPVETAPLVSV